nr:addiction module protein [Candidatus Sigynarchaeota archaeon]
MVSKINKLEKEALQLSPRERATLAERLLHSLDGNDDPDAERAWIEEAERRYQEYKRSGMTGKPAEKVFSEIRSKIK